MVQQIIDHFPISRFGGKKQGFVKLRLHICACIHQCAQAVHMPRHGGGAQGKVFAEMQIGAIGQRLTQRGHITLRRGGDQTVCFGAIFGFHRRPHREITVWQYPTPTERGFKGVIGRGDARHKMRKIKEKT